MTERLVTKYSIRTVSNHYNRLVFNNDLNNLNDLVPIRTFSLVSSDHRRREISNDGEWREVPIGHVTKINEVVDDSIDIDVVWSEGFASKDFEQCFIKAYIHFDTRVTFIFRVDEASYYHELMED